MSDEELRVLANPKWIRGVHDGVTFVDSRDSLLVWENRYYPAWYFPADDVVAELIESGATEQSENRGVATVYDLTVGSLTLPGAGIRYHDGPDQIADRVRINFDAVSSWFEEDVEVFRHPRSPFVRVDTLASSRTVRVSVNGVELAKSSKPTILFETGHPSRYYIPKADVRTELFEPSDSETACPYKGWANYWNVKVGDVSHQDLAWGYRTALPESGLVAGLVCFYNERVDIEIDGEQIERPNPIGPIPNAFG